MWNDPVTYLVIFGFVFWIVVMELFLYRKKG